VNTLLRRPALVTFHRSARSCSADMVELAAIASAPVPLAPRRPRPCNTRPCEGSRHALDGRAQHDHVGSRDSPERSVGHARHPGNGAAVIEASRPARSPTCTRPIARRNGRSATSPASEVFSRSMAMPARRCWPSVATSGSPSAGPTSDAASTNSPRPDRRRSPRRRSPA
jgi:hypothetical protein